METKRQKAIFCEQVQPTYSFSHRIANSRATASSRAATAVRTMAGVDGVSWVTSGRRKQASDRARNTEQHNSMSRKELNVGLATVCTAACVSTWDRKGREGENQKRYENMNKHTHKHEVLMKISQWK